jgi:hypothetical protein
MYIQKRLIPHIPAHIRHGHPSLYLSSIQTHACFHAIFAAAAAAESATSNNGPAIYVPATTTTGSIWLARSPARSSRRPEIYPARPDMINLPFTALLTLFQLLPSFPGKPATDRPTDRPTERITDLLTD